MVHRIRFLSACLLLIAAMSASTASAALEPAERWKLVNKKAKTLALRYRSENDPAAPNTGYVRGELINSRFVLTSLEGGTKTSLLAEIHADPKGSVPKWIVNMFQRSWPKDTFSGIKKQLEK